MDSQQGPLREGGVLDGEPEPWGWGLQAPVRKLKLSIITC